MATCDFCSSSAVRWSYPARDFVVSDLTERLRAQELPGVGSEGSWAACETCHRLIQHGDRTAIAVRAGRKFARRYDVPASLVLPELRKLHDQFWANREGPPTPYQETNQ